MKRPNPNSFPVTGACIRALVGAISIALFASPTAFGETANLPGYFTRMWHTEDGLPNDAVSAILQTRDGYLWLATYDGLARFDGVTFTRFDTSTTPEMHSTRVTSLFEDTDGNLWIGYETGELTRYRDGHFYTTEFRAPWEQKKIQTIRADSSGDLWLLNDAGTLADLAGKVVATPNAAGTAGATALVSDSKGTVWADWGGNAFILKDGALRPLPSRAGDYVKGICTGEDGSLWIIGQNYLSQWKDGQMHDEGQSPLGQSPVVAMIQMKSGCLAIGTLDQGLFLIFPGRNVEHFSRANGFPDNWVRCLCEDREGTLWVGTGSGGLLALRQSRVTTLKPPDEWQGASVLSINRSHDGSLWVGTEGAGLYRFYDGNWTRFAADEGIPNPFVWSVSEDAQNQLWVGTWGGGLAIKNGNRFDPVAATGPSTVATAILHGQNGVTWIGTITGLLKYQNGAITHYGEKEGIMLPDVRTLAQEPDGTIWFGMLGGGLGRLKNGVIRQFRQSDGLSSDFVQCLYLDDEGTLWIGTYGGGLDRLKQDRFSAVGVNQGLPNNYICAIQQDSSKNFWVTSHAGIFRIQKSELIQCADKELSSIHPLVYGIGDGMPTVQCSGGFQPVSFRSSDGRLWFSTRTGVVAINPDEIKVNQLPPPVHIERMLVDGQAEAGIDGTNSLLRIPPGRERFQFDYTGISFISPEKMDFKYRLYGLDPGWTDAGNKRTVVYSYIPPGTYHFQVTACNSDGVPNSTGASLAFVVQPFFYQTWWFLIGSGLAAAAVLTSAVLGVARWRMRQKLERVERQRAIERERARIARDIHDNLGANLTRISLLSQSAHGDLDHPRDAAVQLDRIYQTTREMTRAMDEIVWAVNPEHDTLDSVVNYLGKFAQEYLGSLGIRCRLDLPVQLPQWLVTAEVRHHLFLAFKEALHNVVKHAAASEVSVSLTTTSSSFTLVVRDNGRGFSPKIDCEKNPAESVRSSGNGLVNMRMRLEKIGGRCEIQSAPGSGTEVKFIVELLSHHLSGRKFSPN
ncbi:MAG TPA: two-component regulator propeller domain-containing protein [Candidatus Sulfotelmatobacter sp.]|nr:two-component regulator propeller domain-containing protein [Candidatus Sulfotelmatobacter sp.]